MDLQAAVAVAKQHVSEMLAPEIPGNVRLENFLYDDHLAVWSLTIGYALPNSAEPRDYKIVRVSEVNKTVLSVSDR
jgi:hypothetical protein